ncbi:MAG: hypothetical protein Q9214_003399, partial [Letrouitia sp. 1 TL-2023]
EDANALRKGHEAEKIRLGDEQRAAEARRDSAMEQIQRLESDKKALTDEKEHDTKALEAKVHSARERVKEVQDEMAGKEQELTATKVSLDKARAAAERRETMDKGTTTDDTTTTTTTIDTADAEKMALQQQLDQANQEKSTLVQQLTQSAQDHRSALHQLDQCRAAHNSLVGQVSQFQQSQSEMGKGVEQLQRELAQAQTDKVGLFECAKTEFDQNNKVKDGEIRDLQGQIQGLRNDLELCQQQGRRLEEERKGLTEFDQNNEVKDGEIRDLQGQIQGLRNDLELCQQQGRKLEEERKELTEKNNELKQKNNSLQLDVAIWEAAQGIETQALSNHPAGQPSQSLEEASGEPAQQEAPASSASAIGGNGEFNFNVPPMPTSSSGAQPRTASASDPSARPATPVFSSIPGLFTGQTPTPDQSNQPPGQGIARAYNIPRSRRPRTAPHTMAEGSSSALPPPAPQPPTPGQGSQAKREADPEDHYMHSVVGARQPLSQQQHEYIDPEIAAMGLREEDLCAINDYIADHSSRFANQETVDPYRQYEDSEFAQYNPLIDSGFNPATAAAHDRPGNGTDNGPIHFPPELIDPLLLEQANPIDPTLLAQNPQLAPTLNTPADPPVSEQMSVDLPRSHSPERADQGQESSSSSEAD